MIGTDAKSVEPCHSRTFRGYFIKWKGEILISKYCAKCGTQIKDGDAFCAGCGAPQMQQTAYQQPQAEQQTVYQPRYNNDNTRTVAQPDYHYDAPESNNDNYDYDPGYTSNDTLPPHHMGPGGQMKWFKFVIYVQLFLAALGSLGTAGLYAGEISDLNSVSSYYATFYYSDLAKLLKNCITLDTVFIVVHVVLAVLAIFVRFRLAKFRQNGPILYLGFLTVSMLATLVRTIFYAIICGQINNLFGYTAIPLDLGATIVSIIVSIVMIVLNFTYFQKRRYLFIN